MMNRQEAVAALAEILDDAIVVTGLGNVALDLFVAAERPLNFYTSGAMGTAISIAFGLALAQPDRRVICLEGDGSLLMNLGCLATIGKYQPANLTCLIFDNELYQITGGQPTHTGASTDLAAVARGCGVEQAAAVSTILELRNELARTVGRTGPTSSLPKWIHNSQRASCRAKEFSTSTVSCMPSARLRIRTQSSGASHGK